MEDAGTGSSLGNVEAQRPELESQYNGTELGQENDVASETDMIQGNSSAGEDGAHGLSEHPGGQERAPVEKDGEASQEGDQVTSHGEEGGQVSSNLEGGDHRLPLGDEGGQVFSHGEQGGQVTSHGEGGQVSSYGEEGGQVTSHGEGGQVSSHEEEGGQGPVPGEGSDIKLGTGTEEEDTSLQKPILEYPIPPIPEEETGMGDFAEALETTDPKSTTAAEEDLHEAAKHTIPDTDSEIMTSHDPEEIEEYPYHETESTSQEEFEDLNSKSHEDEEEVKNNFIRQYQVLISEREKIQHQNAQLQNKLYEFFRRKKGEDARHEVGKHVSDQEQRYLKYLSTLEEIKKKYISDAAFHQQQIDELRSECQEDVSRVDKEWKSFQEHKKAVALHGPHGGVKRVSSTFVQALEQLQAKEERKEKEVIQVRLENIKLKNKIHYFESILKSKEELSEGLHLIDFEQLKIENQTYNEKIEERNEELLKLRKKITNTVQMLSHVKEKLQFVQAENQDQRDKLMEVEAFVAQKRDILTKTKQARDGLRMDNLKLKQQCGLLGNKTLLRDFEDKVDATAELERNLETLKRRHAELTLSSKGMVKKIGEGKIPAHEQ